MPLKRPVNSEGTHTDHLPYIPVHRPHVYHFSIISFNMLSLFINSSSSPLFLCLSFFSSRDSLILLNFVIALFNAGHDALAARYMHQFGLTRDTERAHRKSRSISRSSELDERMDQLALQVMLMIIRRKEVSFAPLPRSCPIFLYYPTPKSPRWRLSFLLLRPKHDYNIESLCTH